MTKKICPICKEEFFCGANDGHCWCFDYEVLNEVNSSSSSCYCSICLKNLLEKQSEKID